MWVHTLHTTAAEVKSLTIREDTYIIGCPEGTKHRSVHITALSHEVSIKGRQQGGNLALKSFSPDMTVWTLYREVPECLMPFKKKVRNYFFDSA